MTRQHEWKAGRELLEDMDDEGQGPWKNAYEEQTECS